MLLCLWIPSCICICICIFWMSLYFDLWSLYLHQLTAQYGRQAVPLGGQLDINKATTQLGAESQHEYVIIVREGWKQCDLQHIVKLHLEELDNDKEQLSEREETWVKFWFTACCLLTLGLGHHSFFGMFVNIWKHLDEDGDLVFWAFRAVCEDGCQWYLRLLWVSLLYNRHIVINW